MASRRFATVRAFSGPGSTSRGPNVAQEDFAGESKPRESLGRFGRRQSPLQELRLLLENVISEYEPSAVLDGET